MAQVPPLQAKLCSQCQYSLSFPLYDGLYANDASRAFTPIHTHVTESDVRALESELESTNVAISHLETPLTKLRQRRVQIQRHLRGRKMFLSNSPIRFLPTEVLSIIFRFACQSNDLADYRTPLNLSLTCFKWRCITHDAQLSFLWTNIHVGVDQVSQDLYWFFKERAKGLPLNVHIALIKKKWVADNGAALPMYDYGTLQRTLEHYLFDILATSERWRNLRLCMSAEDLNAITTILDDRYLFSFPELESLSLMVLGDRYPADVLKVFHRAPKLSTLYTDAQGCINGWRHELPYDQIHQLHLIKAAGFPSFLESRDVNAFGRIHTLVLEECQLFNPFTVGLSGTQFNITTLVLKPASYRQVASTFRYLWLPYLEALTLRCPTDVNKKIPMQAVVDLLQAIPVMLRNSPCHLLAFELHLPPYSADDAPTNQDASSHLLEVLRLMPQLRTLSVIEARNTSIVSTLALISGIVDGKLLPALSSLELVWGAGDHVPEESLVEILQSRVGRDDGEMKNLTLVTLGVRDDGELSPLVLNTMKKMRREGVQALLW